MNKKQLAVIGAALVIASASAILSGGGREEARRSETVTLWSGIQVDHVQQHSCFVYDVADQDKQFEICLIDFKARAVIVFSTPRDYRAWTVVDLQPIDF